MTRHLWLLSLSFALAGCNSVVDDPYLKTVSITPDAPALATSVSPDQALASVPLLASRVSAVRQTLGADQVEQTIVLPNATDLPGENAIYVVAGRANKDNGLSRAPSAGGLQAEMRERLSGIPMTISAVIADNAQGVFGFATGPAGRSGSCLYAWQTTRGDGVSQALKGGYSTQVRLRFCHPSIGQDRIAGLMKDLRIRAVTPETLKSLRSGIAVAHRPGFGEGDPSPVIALSARDESLLTSDRADVAMADPVEPVVRKRRKPLRVVAIEPASEEPAIATEKPVANIASTPAQETVIRNAARIPMPGEAAGTADVQGAAANKGSFVPLPTATTTTAN